MVGHMCALVRTSPSPDPTFLLLAGDAAHFRAQYSCLPHHPHPPLQAGLFPTDDHTALTALHEDLHTAYETKAKMGRMEEENAVCVVLAHDREWERVLEADFGGWEVLEITKWKDKGWKGKVQQAREHT